MLTECFAFFRKDMQEFLSVLLNLSPLAAGNNNNNPSGPLHAAATTSGPLPTAAATSPLQLALDHNCLHMAQLLVWVRFFF